MFLQADPVDGLGTTPELVEAILHDDPDALVLHRRAMKQKPGKRSHDIVTRIGKGMGNGRAYACDKLDRERPELYAKVLAGELSAHAAMVKAGFRKKATPLQDAQRLWGKMTQDEKRSFKAWLAEQS